MTAFETFKTLHGEGWQNAVDAHLQQGFAYFDPLNIALARPISHLWPAERFSDPWDSALSETDLTRDLDCWYVWAAIGDLKYLLSLIPYPLPLIAFVRRRSGRVSPVKFYQFEKFFRKPGPTAPCLTPKNSPENFMTDNESA